ncbi:hypothetical protein AJ88_23665 [Mesorhizobium amorphae CCBAU 01583]|nr:hypothetical protein AJ88_23665 [Mesorhizobium amorphae CCBAU 01583]
MNDLTLPLSGLSSVGGKAVVARFDGGMLSSNGGVLALAEVEKRRRVADRLARCIDDPRCPDQVVHSVADMIGFSIRRLEVKRLLDLFRFAGIGPVFRGVLLLSGVGALALPSMGIQKEEVEQSFARLDRPVDGGQSS